jgi:predicted membrane chloride channel (bestrophin family)
MHHSYGFVLKRPVRESSKHLRTQNERIYIGSTTKLKESVADNIKNDALDALEKDLQILTKVRPAEPSSDISFPTHIVSAGSSYTRIYTKQTWNIHSHPPHRRYFRHVRKWTKSATARKIFPTVLLATCWSILVSSSIEYFQVQPLKNVISRMAGTSSAVSLLSAPLALLLTLRANASMARLLEARQMWGKLVLHSRGLSSILANYVYPMNPHAAILSIRYLSLLGWILKAQVRCESKESQEQIFKVMLSSYKQSTEYEWITQQSKESVAILSRVRQICSIALGSSLARISDSRYQQIFLIEERLQELEACIGVNERLFGSPIPPTYTRHLSRVISLWLLLLPVSLVVNGGLSTMTTAFVVTIAAYVFVGLDEVGMEIENVYQLLPLQQLAAAAQKDVQDQFLMLRNVPMGISTGVDTTQ